MRVESVPLDRGDGSSLSSCGAFGVELDSVTMAVEITGDQVECLTSPDAGIDRAEAFVAMEKAPQTAAFFPWKRVVAEFQTTGVAQRLSRTPERNIGDWAKGS